MPKESVRSYSVVKEKARPVKRSDNLRWVYRQEGGAWRLNGDGDALHGCRMWLYRNLLTALYEALDIPANGVLCHGARFIHRIAFGDEFGQRGTVTRYRPSGAGSNTAVY